MAWGSLLGWFWRRPGLPETYARPAPLPPRPGRRPPVAHGARVRLRAPLATPHTVHIAAGAVGIVVGGNPTARQVSVELDAPRTVITVPWSWVEPEPPPEENPTPAAPDPPAR